MEYTTLSVLIALAIGVIASLTANYITANRKVIAGITIRAVGKMKKYFYSFVFAIIVAVPANMIAYRLMPHDSPLINSSNSTIIEMASTELLTIETEILEKEQRLMNIDISEEGDSIKYFQAEGDIKILRINKDALETLIQAYKNGEVDEIGLEQAIKDVGINLNNKENGN